MKLMDKLLSIVSRIDNVDDLQKNGQLWLRVFKEAGIITSNTRMLDYGAGLGRISIPFSSICKVTAVDGNLEMVKYLRKAGISAKTCRDGKNLTGTYDFVMVAYVFQHIPTELTRKILGRLALMAPTLYFTFPTFELFEELRMTIPPSYKPESVLDISKVGEFKTHEFGSVLLFKKQLLDMLDECGWNIASFVEPFPEKIKGLYRINRK